MNSIIEGFGQPMILLHGWGLSMQSMEPIFEAFKSNYKVCLLDLPGFGLSNELDDYDNFNDYMQEIINFINQFQLHNPIIIAHSFGARIAIRYASKYPVKLLVLTGAAGIKKPLTLSKKCAVLLFKVKKHLRIHSTRGSIDYQNATPFLRKVLVQVVNQDLSHCLPLISAPTLLVFGDEDNETPVWMGKKMAELIPISALILFEGDDHFAYLHQMNRFISLIHHFIEGSE